MTTIANNHAATAKALEVDDSALREAVVDAFRQALDPERYAPSPEDLQERLPEIIAHWEQLECEAQLTRDEVAMLIKLYAARIVELLTQRYVSGNLQEHLTHRTNLIRLLASERV
jgi:hypothetical protein